MLTRTEQTFASSTDWLRSAAGARLTKRLRPPSGPAPDEISNDERMGDGSKK